VRPRSVLFIPADRPDLAAKAPRSSPDAIVLDLEDAIPADAKDDARAGLGDALAAAAGVEVYVRVNPPGTEWFEDDVAAVPAGVSGVVIPKLESAVDLGLPVVAGLETVRGVVDAASILRGAVACYFGAEDYVADLGGVRTPGNDEIRTARAMVAMSARLAQVPAFDMVTLDFTDGARFSTEAGEARALGYAGKLCIHPAQVALANAAFLPSEVELDRAERLLSAFDAADGRTIAFEGGMVDEVVARQARQLLARSSPP
jgi:citrate lyase subunit beta/citryl-CoA lyase